MIWVNSAALSHAMAHNLTEDDVTFDQCVGSDDVISEERSGTHLTKDSEF